MVIAIDFDGTLKSSSQVEQDECVMWRQVVDAFQAQGHTVIIATARRNTFENRREVMDYLQVLGRNLPVVMCYYTPKRQACKEHGYNVAIVIDDMPEMWGAPVLLSKTESGN